MLILFTFISCRQSDRGLDGESSVIVDTTSTEVREPEDPLKFLIADQQAGPFKIGDELPGPATMMKYKMRVEQQTRQTEEGPVTEPVTIIGEGDEDLLWLKPGILSSSAEYSSTITEIIVVSSKYKTEKQIGIGSSLTDFRMAYPDAKVWYTYVSQMYVAETDQVKVQFILNGDDYTGAKPEIESDITPMMLSDFKTGAKIQRIRIL